MSKKKTPEKPAQAAGERGQALSAEELAAMKETLAERRRARSGTADGEADVVAKIAEMPKSDRAIAERVHAIIKATAPDLRPKTWYGMPAYERDGKVICFFQSAAKFRYRYATLGFQEHAKLDDGDIWPTSYAVNKLTPAVEAKIAKLVKQAVG